MDNTDLKKAGLKVTLPRLRVLEILEKSPNRHMSAEDVYRAMLDAEEDIGLATIYRVLTQFEAAGLVVRHNFEGGHAVFELDSGQHHDHIVCTQCGKIVEFMDKMIEQRQVNIAKEHGFKVSDHSLVLYGKCVKPQCPNRPATG